MKGIGGAAMRDKGALLRLTMRSGSIKRVVRPRSLARGIDRARGCPIMNTDKRTAYVTRDSILTLLTDDEVARVATAETTASLVDGDEYIDLEKLGRGAHQAGALRPTMGSVLPRKAVQAQTWSKILAHLETSRA
jgi:hypothetical protein